MTPRSAFRLFSPWAAALAAFLTWTGAASAADTPPVPLPAAPLVAGPVMAPMGPSCPTCGGGAPVAAGCADGRCGKGLFGHGHGHGYKCKYYYTPYLCPGACFGYFQTQWHRWEDVCPIPYQGYGLTDAPPPPTPSVGIGTPPGRPTPDVAPKPSDPKKGTELPAPTPMGPKGAGAPGPLPTIPMPGK